MDIFGLEPIPAAVIITLFGAGLQLGLGYLASSPQTFDWRKALSTAITIGVVGIVSVATTLQALSEDATELEVLIAVATVVAAVAGFDALKNNVIKAAAKRVVPQ